MSLFDDERDTFDAQYRAEALDQFQKDLDQLCLGSGRKGQDAGRLGWAFCTWCQNDIRVDADRGMWLAAHAPSFEYEGDLDRIGSALDDIAEGLARLRERE